MNSIEKGAPHQFFTQSYSLLQPYNDNLSHSINVIKFFSGDHCHDINATGWVHPY